MTHCCLQAGLTATLLNVFFIILSECLLALLHAIPVNTHFSPFLYCQEWIWGYDFNGLWKPHRCANLTMVLQTEKSPMQRARSRWPWLSDHGSSERKLWNGLAFVLYLEEGGKTVFDKGHVGEKVVLESHRCGTYRGTCCYPSKHQGLCMSECLIRRSHHLLLTGRQRLQSF